MKDRRSRTWIEINLDHVLHNYRQAQEKAGNRKMMCVVKADAYGHGAVQIATALGEVGVTHFAVATAEEALQLRRHNINSEILLLGAPAPSEIMELNYANIKLTVGSGMIADIYALILEKHKKKQKIHVKVNSGMTRQGISLDNAVTQILQISKHSCFEIEGLYTHLAVADCTNEDAFTKEQYENTLHIVKCLANQGLHIPLFHVANSAGIIAHSYMKTDLVRPGLMLYGSNPCANLEVNLKPVMSLHTRIIHILNVKRGESVGYGRTWKADKDSVIAVLGIGYADGLMRCLSGVLPVIVKGKRVKQVGRICMDMCMIDVTNIKKLRIGDIATIIGTQEDSGITVDEVAKLYNTISYEVFCAIGKRVPRIYMKENKEVCNVCYIELL